jgi:nicotinamidase/pyrazinamidase
MQRNIQLLMIDPQNDFCDLPMAYRPVDARTGECLSPALPVAGAHADMERLARFIREGADGLTDMAVTLDSHHRLDIAHLHERLPRAGAGRRVALGIVAG